MSAVVTEARRWIGTPYLHQASVCGVGTDCLGLIRGVWRALIGTEPEAPPGYTADWGEPGGEELLSAAALRHLIRAEDEEAAGQVILFRMRRGAVAKHLGILSRPGPNGAFIHAYDRHGVVESPLTGPWRARICGRFCFPL